MDFPRMRDDLLYWILLATHSAIHSFCHSVIPSGIHSFIHWGQCLCMYSEESPLSLYINAGASAAPLLGQCDAHSPKPWTTDHHTKWIVIVAMGRNGLGMSFYRCTVHPHSICCVWAASSSSSSSSSSVRLQRETHTQTTDCGCHNINTIPFQCMVYGQN